MSKDNLIGLIFIGTIIVIGGFIMIFYSVNFGMSLAESWLSKQGGTDTGTYHIIIEGYINNFLVAGGILLSFGIVLVSVASFKWILILKEE